MITYTPKYKITVKKPSDDEIVDVADKSVRNYFRSIYSTELNVLYNSAPITSYEEDLSTAVIALKTSKAYGRSSGSYEIILVNKFITPNAAKKSDRTPTRLADFIQPGDIVFIRLDEGDGTGFQMVMAGPVERVALRESMTAEGKPDIRVVIFGNDFGVLLERINLGWDISGKNAQKEFGLDEISTAVIRRYNLPSGSPGECLEYLFTKIFLPQIDKAIYSRYFYLYIETNDDWKCFTPDLATTKGTTAWAAFKRLANEPWNVLTTQTAPDGTLKIILERQPLDADGYSSRMQYWQLDDRDLVSCDIGQSEAERVNLLCHWPFEYQMVQAGLIDLALADPQLTRMDEDSIRTYGVRQLVIETPFSQPSDDIPLCFARPVNANYAIQRAKQYWAWFSQNHKLKSGTFTIRMRPGIQPGDTIVRQITGEEFRIESVSHHFTPSMSRPYCQTILEVSRGQKTRFDPVGWRPWQLPISNTN